MQRLLCHLAGDYLTQTSWMAQEKTKRSAPAAAHALSYTACFLPITKDWRRLAIIGGSHFVIDRWRLAKHVTWAKNQLAPVAWRPPHTATGYGTEQPDWLTFWLLILADNTIHLFLNELALHDWKSCTHQR